MATSLRLEQGQVWKQGNEYFRIVHLERLKVDYKQMKDVDIGEGKHFQATKKEFCRLIKGASLMGRPNTPMPYVPPPAE